MTMQIKKNGVVLRETCLSGCQQGVGKVFNVFAGVGCWPKAGQGAGFALWIGRRARATRGPWEASSVRSPLRWTRVVDAALVCLRSLEVVGVN